MRGCPRLPRAMSVGRCGGDSFAASFAELLTPKEEEDISNLSLPIRSLEISPWNDVEWSLIPPIVSSSIMEMRNGMQIVYDMLTNSISSMRASITTYNQMATRLDTYHLEFGKRISALEMKLDTIHLRQSSILEKLNVQQKTIVHHTNTTNAMLDAQFERTKLLVDSALRKFNPPTDMELDAIALRLSSNPTLLTTINNMQVAHSQESLQIVQELNTHLEDVDQQLSLCKKNSQELAEIVENNARHFTKYQARIGERLRLLDELPVKLEQLENINQLTSNLSDNKHQAQPENVTQEMKEEMISLKDELNELRASLTDKIRRMEKSSLNSHNNLSYPTPPSVLPPIQNSRLSSSDRKRTATPRDSKVIKLHPDEDSSYNTNNCDKVLTKQETISNTNQIIQQHPSTMLTMQSSSIQPQNSHIKNYDEDEDSKEKTNNLIDDQSSKPASRVLYVDEPEFYQDCHRPVVTRVDPQRYKSTVLLVSDKNTRPYSANVQQQSSIAVRDMLLQISTQLPHNSRLIKSLVTKLIPELLPYFGASYTKPEKADDSYSADLQNKLDSITQQIEPLNTSISFMMNKINEFSLTLDGIIESEMRSLTDKVEKAIAIATSIPQKHTDLISDVNKKMELVRESLQLSIYSSMKSTMDTIDLRDKTYATKTAMSQLSRAIISADSRFSLHENIILQLYNCIVRGNSPNPLGSFTDVAHELGVETYIHDAAIVVPANSSVNSELSSCSATVQEQVGGDYNKKFISSRRSATVSAPPTKIKQSTQILPGQSHLASAHSRTHTRSDGSIKISSSLMVSYYDTALPDSSPSERHNRRE